MRGFYFIGGNFIPYYGLMMAIGIFAAFFAANIIIKKNKLDSYDFLILCIYALIGGIIGAKLLYILVNIPNYDYLSFSFMEFISFIFGGGLVFYGGLIGGLIAVPIGAKIHKLSCKPYMLIGIPCFPLAHAFGRIGCALAGCCFGRPYDGPFAITYHYSDIVDTGVPLETPLFPIQLVEAFFLLVIFILLYIRLIKKEPSMINVCLYGILYSILRFIIEQFRYDHLRGHFLFLSTSGWISIILFIISIALLLKQVLKSRSYG